MGEQDYSGIATALLRLGHTIYDPATIDTELAIQLSVDLGKRNTRAAFRDFVIIVQQFSICLAILGGQLHVTMVHTPGV
jgi:hypothetical protein